MSKNIKGVKEIKIVSTEWEEIIDPEYYFSIKCPYCKQGINNSELLLGDGEKINKQFKCPDCGKKFKLKVKEL